MVPVVARAFSFSSLYIEGGHFGKERGDKNSGSGKWVIRDPAV